MTSKVSPFLFPGSVAQADSLSIIHLKRDLQIPTILKEHDEDDEGYFEGKVVNTRFGSFPHRTLIGLPWGSQVRASKVDTGSRGRRGKGVDKKRKRDDGAEGSSKATKLEESSSPRKVQEDEDADADMSTPTAIKEEKEAVTASTGFIHLLPPTPENWTSSLPHRTQVVYTPDYSYILHRIRARPGKSLIEAGAGSGSFTHASARAVYSGYPGMDEVNGSPSKKRKLGQVWSFEFHEVRHQKLQKEIQDHGLEGIVAITHRDVCEDGFLVDGKSPNAESIFLDLPAPWLALSHLARSRPASRSKDGMGEEAKPFTSPLNPAAPVYVCTFSPCIEQVQKTVSTMRQLGWVDIEMVELSQKRFEIRRERIGISTDSQRGVQSTPASVDEAIARLKEVEGTFKQFHENSGEKAKVEGGRKERRERPNPNNRESILEALVERKVYKEGRLVHRTEPEVKTHTSYLVFAVLPVEWSEEDEERARQKWDVKGDNGEEDVGLGSDGKGVAEIPAMSRKERKRAERQAKMDADRAAKREAGGETINGTSSVDAPAESK
jgi:tRNA (adenine57-N1/adenine58-N1)-methyltransferase